LINVTWVSRNLETAKQLPNDQELFGTVMDKLK